MAPIPPVRYIFFSTMLAHKRIRAGLYLSPKSPCGDRRTKSATAVRRYTARTACPSIVACSSIGWCAWWYLNQSSVAKPPRNNGLLDGSPVASSFGVILWDFIFSLTTSIGFDIIVMPPFLTFGISPLLDEEPGQLKMAWVVSDVVQPKKGKFNLWVTGITSFLTRSGAEETVKEVYVLDDRTQQ
jgi:hypothetical protein